MLLDAWDQIFIWIGLGANKVERENAVKVAIVSKATALHFSPVIGMLYGITNCDRNPFC